MLEIGTILRAKVVRVEPYGVFLQHGDEKIFVHLPEVSWRDRRPLQEWIHPGEVIDVLAIGYNYIDRAIIASMRRIYPDENPFRELARLEPGTVLVAKVKATDGDELSVALSNGAWGHLPKLTLTRIPDRGDDIEVVISDLWADDGRARFEPARLADRSPNCRVEVQLPQLSASA